MSTICWKIYHLGNIYARVGSCAESHDSEWILQCKTNQTRLIKTIETHCGPTNSDKNNVHQIIPQEVFSEAPLPIDCQQHAFVPLHKPHFLPTCDHTPPFHSLTKSLKMILFPDVYWEYHGSA